MTKAKPENHQHKSLAAKETGERNKTQGAGASNLRLLFWETTAACNLECLHCRRLDVRQEMARSDLNTEQALALVDAVREVGQPIFVLSGGEPLVRADIFQIAAYAHDQGLPVALASNGTMITPDVAQRIVDSGIRRVAVSLDGADSQTHDVFRQQAGSFAAALAGIANLRELEMSVQVNCTVTRHNVESMPDMHRLVKELGADAWHIFMLVPVGCGAELADEEMLSATKYEEVLNWFYDISQTDELQTKATCAPHYFRIAHQRAREEKKASAGPPPSPSPAAKGHPGGVSSSMHTSTRGCLAGSAVCFVSHQGDVFPCGYLPVSAGNVTDTSLKNIWENSAVFQHLRRPEELGGKCGVCEYRVACAGCRARAFAQTGDYLAEEPFCLYLPKKAKNQSKP